MMHHPCCLAAQGKKVPALIDMLVEGEGVRLSNGIIVVQAMHKDIACHSSIHLRTLRMPSSINGNCACCMAAQLHRNRVLVVESLDVTEPHGACVTKATCVQS